MEDCVAMWICGSIKKRNWSRKIDGVAILRHKDKNIKKWRDGEKRRAEDMWSKRRCTSWKLINEILKKKDVSDDTKKQQTFKDIV